MMNKEHPYPNLAKHFEALCEIAPSMKAFSVLDKLLEDDTVVESQLTFERAVHEYNKTISNFEAARTRVWLSPIYRRRGPNKSTRDIEQLKLHYTHYRDQGYSKTHALSIASGLMQMSPYNAYKYLKRPNGKGGYETP